MTHAQQDLCLIDSSDRCLGHVVVETVRGDRLLAEFTPQPDFDSARELFRRLEDAVNDQLFQEVDDLSEQIELLNLKLMPAKGHGLYEVRDAQIMNGTAFSCRVRQPELLEIAPSKAIA